MFDTTIDKTQTKSDPTRRQMTQVAKTGETTSVSAIQTAAMSSQATSPQHRIIISPKTCLPKKDSKSNLVLSAPSINPDTDVFPSPQSSDMNPGVPPRLQSPSQIPCLNRYPRCVWKEDRELDIREDLPPPILEGIEEYDDEDCWLDEWDY